MRKQIILGLAIATMMGCGIPSAWAQRKSNEAAAAPIVLTEGVNYMLPRTCIKFTIKAQCQQFVAGPYAAYASKYLGIGQTETVNKTTWKILSIKGTPFSEPDPSATFKSKGEYASLISLTADGRIAGIGTKTTTPDQCLSAYNEPTNIELPKEIFPDRSSDYFFDVVVDTASGAERTIFKSTETKAREAADYIINMRKKRTYHLVDSYDELPPDGKAYEVLVEESKRLEKIYLELFIGKNIETEHEFVVTYIPGNDQVKNDIAFRISEEKGVVPKSDLSGRPIVISMTKEAPSVEKGEINEHGIYYRVPAMSQLTLSDGATQIFSQRLAISQFGSTVALPAQFLSGSHQIKFDTNLGSIIEIENKNK